MIKAALKVAARPASVTLGTPEDGRSIQHLGWLRGLRRYLGLTALGNVLWETAQLPLYTIWEEGTPREKVIAVLHCTGGDLLISLCALALALVIAGRPGWPGQAFRGVAILTIAFGLAYTTFSEWLNITVRQSWAYSDLMPVIPGLGLGLSPAMQWVLIPIASLWFVRRISACEDHRQTGSSDTL
jgi:hypothetical protein